MEYVNDLSGAWRLYVFEWYESEEGSWVLRVGSEGVEKYLEECSAFISFYMFRNRCRLCFQIYILIFQGKSTRQRRLQII